MFDYCAGVPHPMTKICPQCGTTMHCALVYPHPELGSHWLCPVDGSKWELTMDGAKLVPFRTIHRESVGHPINND
jgi:hypothetical protein